MREVSASNGGGFVKDEELATALGMFMLAKSGVTMPGKLVEHCPDQTWTYEWQGKVYRANLVYGVIPGAYCPQPVALNFDYIRQVEPPDDVLTLIAAKELNIDSLRVQGADSLDFHEVGVSQLHDALAAAYNAGRNSK